jgi:hypothetical protein
MTDQSLQIKVEENMRKRTTKDQVKSSCNKSCEKNKPGFIDANTAAFPQKKTKAPASSSSGSEDSSESMLVDSDNAKCLLL